MKQQLAKMTGAVALGLLLLIVGLAALPPAETQANGSTKTGYIVVRYDDTDVLVRAFTFTNPISGYVALEQAGLNPLMADSEVLCQIDGFGMDIQPDNSACIFAGSYWAYSYWADSAWEGYMTGVADSVISQDGHIEGYSWGSWPVPNPPSATQVIAAHDGLEWLAGEQQADGGYGSAGNGIEVLMAVAANHQDPAQWQQGDGPSLMQNTLQNGPDFSKSQMAGAGKLAVALAGAEDGCWPVEAMKPADYYSDTVGAFGPGSSPQAWGILGHLALSQSVEVTALTYLEGMQQSNGGWEWSPGWGADSNSTALAIQALLAAGREPTSTHVVSGFTYLKSAQNDDGGFTYSPDSPYGTDSDANSTAYAIQAIRAAGDDPMTGTWAVTDSNPISFLLSLQLDDGSFKFQTAVTESRLFATRQAVPALLHRPFPLAMMDLPTCGLTVTKWANLQNAQPGDTITYTYRITNAGEITLSQLSAHDSNLGVITLPKTSLAAGESVTGMLAFTVTDERGELTNTVTATGTLPSGVKMMAMTEASVELPYDIYLPSIMKP